VLTIRLPSAWNFFFVCVWLRLPVGLTLQQRSPHQNPQIHPLSPCRPRRKRRLDLLCQSPSRSQALPPQLNHLSSRRTGAHPFPVPIDSTAVLSPLILTPATSHPHQNAGTRPSPEQRRPQLFIARLRVPVVTPAAAIRSLWRLVYDHCCCRKRWRRNAKESTRCTIPISRRNSSPTRLTQQTRLRQISSPPSRQLSLREATFVALARHHHSTYPIRNIRTNPCHRPSHSPPNRANDSCCLTCKRNLLSATRRGDPEATTIRSCTAVYVR
jgi:hypothetical protein